jgi:thiol-disulfide isomerase/thioredoxin
VVVHFFHKEFQRCTVMDHHLKLVAVRHVECKFLRIDAEKAPFFVQKLQIKTLPTVLVAQNGKVVDRLVGFDGFQSKHVSGTRERRQFESAEKIDVDDWETSELQKWLASVGAISFCEANDDSEQVGREKNRLRGGIRHFDEDDN